MDETAEWVQRLAPTIQIDRLLDTAIQLIEVPSPTRDAGAAADRLTGILEHDGFDVERPVGDWPQAPAVAVRYDSGHPGPVLQFDGHLDTVHLPFVPPRVTDGVLTGSGAADMKGGVAAMCEVLRVLRQTGALPRGSILLTAHDLHEAPWGDGRQLNAIIRAGYVGDAVLIPEYLADRLAVTGRGMAVLRVRITRQGAAMHEVLGGLDQPSVITAGARLIGRLAELDRTLAQQVGPGPERDSVFVGQVASGEIFNQAPVELTLSGTRRWLPGRSADEVERQFHQILREVQQESSTEIDGKFELVGAAFELDRAHPLVGAFQTACQAVMGHRLPAGPKPFIDDGNRILASSGVASITHGPNATGAHTVQERVPVDELKRVALLYALTAVLFCGGHDD